MFFLCNFTTQYTFHIVRHKYASFHLKTDAQICKKQETMHLNWKYLPPTHEEMVATKELSEKLNMSSTLVSLLVKRGIYTESAAKRFFHPQLSDLINPFLLKDMDVAVDRINDARLRCRWLHCGGIGL